MDKKRETTDKLDLNLKYGFEHHVNLRARTILLKGDIDEDSFALVDTAMTEMERYNNKSITIRISSEGGSLYDALAIVGRIHESKCRIITEGYGCVMSAAFLILAAGGKRRISRLAWAMNHEGYYELEGRHSTVKHEVRQRELEENQWASSMAELTERPVNFWKKNGIYTDSYFSANQLLELGVVDEIF